MFRQTVQRAARTFSTSARTAPDGLQFNLRGQSEAGHMNVLQKEGSLLKTWVNPQAKPEIIPIIGVVGFAMLLSAYKLFVVDANAPDTHFSRHERSTLDYIENDRDAKKVSEWGQTLFHTGGSLGKEAQRQKL